MGSTSSPLCKLCSRSSIGTIEHSFIHCDFNDGAGMQLVNCIKTHLPGISDSAILRLELAELEEEKQFPVIILIATTLNFIWTQRMSGSKFRTYQVRSEMEQTINLLRTSRLSKESAKLEDLLYDMYQ